MCGSFFPASTYKDLEGAPRELVPQTRHDLRSWFDLASTWRLNPTRLPQLVGRVRACATARHRRGGRAPSESLTKTRTAGRGPTAQWAHSGSPPRFAASGHPRLLASAAWCSPAPIRRTYLWGET